MRLATILSLGASALLGVGALVVARVWIPATLDHPAVPTMARAEAPVGVPVVVASGELKYGDKLEAKNLDVIRMPAGAAPEGAFASIDQVLAQDEGAPVVLIALARHEPILPGKLSGAGARPTVAAEIGEGMRGYTIKVTDVAGGGGHVFPGDRVDVVLSRDLADTDGSDRPGKRLVADVVLQNVRVLGMNLNANQTSTDPTVPQTATLEVTMGDAQKLAVAGDLGTLSLALRRTGASDVEAARTVAVRDVSPRGEGAPAPRRGGGASSGGGSTITVVHGDKVDAVRVPADQAGA